MMTADSTTEIHDLLEHIERLLEKKLKPLEVKINMVQHRQDMISASENHEKLVPILHKIQRKVEDVADQQDSSSRKLKDEIYNIQGEKVKN